MKSDVMKGIISLPDFYTSKSFNPFDLIKYIFYMFLVSHNIRMNFFHILVEMADNYMYNPHSRTCIRLVTEEMTQPEAQAFCEVDGEQLATFRTAESMQWLRDQHAARGGNYPCIQYWFSVFELSLR